MVFLGFLFSAIISYFAYKKHALSKSGVFGAMIIGTVYFGFGSLKWYGILLVFFVSSSLLSRFRINEKKKWEEGFEKTGKRDFGQTMANGGVGGIVIILAWLYPEWQLPLYIAFLGVMATVTADTWGTEIGVLSKQSPRHILTGKVIETGQSGGITLLGSLASFMGAWIIGIIGMMFQADTSFYWVILVSIAGLAGAFTDSLLGALWQRMNRCTICGKLVESKRHCGASTIYSKGLKGLNNDWVNAISSFLGGIIAMILIYVSAIL